LDINNELLNKNCDDCLHFKTCKKPVFMLPYECSDFVDTSIDNPKLQKLVDEGVVL